MTYTPKSGWKEWFKKRWFDLRNGYSLYLSIVLGFFDFILIVSVKFPMYSIIVLILMIGTSAAAAATSIGYLHRRHQLGTDQDSAFEHMRLQASVLLTLLHATEGKATQEELRQVEKLLADIRDGNY